MQDSGSEAHKGVDAQPLASYDLDAGAHYTWTARVRGTSGNKATAYTRNQTFAVYGQASFKEADPHPSAVEYLLGALGSDLVTGFAAHAARRGFVIDALEASISGRLNNPLVFGRGRRNGPPGIRGDKRHALREHRRRRTDPAGSLAGDPRAFAAREHAAALRRALAGDADHAVDLLRRSRSSLTLGYSARPSTRPRPPGPCCSSDTATSGPRR